MKHFENLGAGHPGEEGRHRFVSIINFTAEEAYMNKSLPCLFCFLAVLALAGICLISSAPAEDQPPVQMRMQKQEPITIIQKKTPLDQPLEAILPVNVNATDIATLKKIPGISSKAAREIIYYRDRHGKYTSLEQLVGFPGISESDIPELKKYLILE
jgi:hypothetical protein